MNLGINKNENKLFILIKSKNIFEVNYYQFESTYEELLISYKFFNAFESLEEIKEELEKFFSEKKMLHNHLRK